MKILNTPDADNSTVRSIMSDEVKRSGHKQMILIDRDGNALYDNGVIAVMKDSPIFNRVMSGEEIVTDPMLDNDGSSIIMYYAVPVKVDGEIAGALVAVRDGLELSEFAGTIK